MVRKILNWIKQKIYVQSYNIRTIVITIYLLDGHAWLHPTKNSIPRRHLSSVTTTQKNLIILRETLMVKIANNPIGWEHTLVNNLKLLYNIQENTFFLTYNSIKLPFWVIFNMFILPNDQLRMQHAFVQRQQLPLISIQCLYCWPWTYFTHCSVVSDADFEQVNTSWVKLP